MIQVTDKFLMRVSEIYVLPYSLSLTLTNNSNTTVEVLISDDNSTFTSLVSVSATQSLQQDISAKYLCIQSDDKDATVYALSARTSHYNSSGSVGTAYDDTELREQIEAIKQKNIEQDTAITSHNVDTLILPDNLALDFPEISDKTTAVYVANTGANFLLVNEDLNQLDEREKLILYKHTTTHNRYLKYQVECRELDLAKIGVQTINSKVLNSAMYVASKYGYSIKLPCKANIAYTEPLWVHEGILGIDGNGSTITFNSGANTSGIITANSNTGVANGKIAGGFFIKNLTVKALTELDTGVYGFFGRDTSHVTLENCTFETVEKEPILFLINPDNIGKEIYHNNETGHCKVLNCTTIYKNKNPNSYQANGIFFNVDMRPIIGNIGMDTYIKNQGENFDGTFPKPMKNDVTRIHTHCEVKRCTSIGSRYGIGGFYLENSVIEHNVCVDNVRGIVLQNNSKLNIIKNNKVYNNSSSAILVNYGCTGNLIESNYLESDVAHGQSFLHTSVFCHDNIFKNNTAKFLYKDINSIEPSKVPMWGLYVGVGCTNVIFEDNHIAGIFRKALLAIESDWIMADTATESYGSNMAVDNRYPTKWANGKPTENIIIRNNTLIQDSQESTAIYMKPNHNVPLRNISFTGNTIRAKNGYRLRQLGATGVVTGGNVYDSFDANKYFFNEQVTYTAMLPDAGRAFATWEKPTTSSGINLIEVGLTNGKINAPTQNNTVVFILPKENETEFRGIVGGIRGQTVIVRYVAGIKAIHSNELRFISGYAPDRVLNGNMSSTFICIANNIWLEVSRGF